MASIAKDPNGRKRLFFYGLDGRTCIRLGKISVRAAEAIKVKVEDLESAILSGCGWQPETARWVAEIPDSLADKLAAKGLIPKRVAAAPEKNLKQFLSEYTTRRIDVKPATQEVWRTNVRSLLDHFGDERELDTIHEGHAEDFKLYLIEQGLAPTTVHKRLQFARQFFRDAVKRQFIGSNPFAEVSAKATIPEDRQHFVTRDDTEQLLEACNPTWKLIVALSRYGGLRCPSEVLSLRWQDVDWASERIRVRSPKTEHHAGKGSRTIPLFSELQPILTEAFELAPDGADYVVGGDYRKSAQSPSGWRNCNLRTQFERIIERAGLQPWPRLFHSLRASRETELAQDYPIHVVTAWLGNTPRIAMKHYLQVTDDDFERATQGGAESGADAAQNRAQQAAAGNCTEWQETTEAPDESRAYAICCDSVQEHAATSSGEDGIRTRGGE